MYVAVADFRAASLKWFTRSTGAVPGLQFSTTEVPDTDLTDAIGAFTSAIDRYTADHFEPENTLTVDVDGAGSPILFVPRRIRSITSVATLNTDGLTYSTQDSSVYKVVSSLNAGGTDFNEFGDDADEIQVIGGRYLAGVAVGDQLPDTLAGIAGGGGYWPNGTQNVRLVGSFGWAAVPERIKRAVALMVWDHFKNWNPDRRRADRWSTQEATYERATTTPTGIPEVDSIIAEYRRTRLVGG